MKPLAALLIILSSLLLGCETTTTEEDYGYGMDFEESSNSDQAKVIE